MLRLTPLEFETFGAVVKELLRFFCMLSDCAIACLSLFVSHRVVGQGQVLFEENIACLFGHELLAVTTPLSALQRAQLLEVKLHRPDVRVLGEWRAGEGRTGGRGARAKESEVLFLESLGGFKRASEEEGGLTSAQSQMTALLPNETSQSDEQGESCWFATLSRPFFFRTFTPGLLRVGGKTFQPNP